LNDTTKAISINTTTLGSKNLDKGFSDVKGVNQKTSSKSLKLLVDKHLKGDNTVTRDEVKQVLLEGIKDATSQMIEQGKVLNKIGVETKKAQDAINILKQDVASSSTASQIKVVSKKLDEVVSKTEKVVTENSKKVLRVEKLLSQDNLDKAVEIVIEATEANTKVVEATDNSIKDLQTVAPDAAINIVNTVSSTASVDSGLRNSTNTPVTGTIQINN